MRYLKHKARSELEWRSDDSYVGFPPPTATLVQELRSTLGDFVWYHEGWFYVEEGRGFVTRLEADKLLSTYKSVPSPLPPVATPGTAPSSRGEGLKFDSGKARWSLLMQGCASALAGVVGVLGFGAQKYAAHSWQSVENGEERYRDALYRHLHAIESGEEIDPESGLPHWDHLCCNALFLSSLAKRGK